MDFRGFSTGAINLEMSVVRLQAIGVKSKERVFVGTKECVRKCSSGGTVFEIGSDFIFVADFELDCFRDIELGSGGQIVGIHRVKDVFLGICSVCIGRNKGDKDDADDAEHGFSEVLQFHNGSRFKGRMDVVLAIKSAD